MAKLSSVNKNETRRKLVKKFAGKRERLLSLANDMSKPADERFEARQKLAKLPRNSNPTRLRNRCALTGRPRGNLRKFGLCRIKVRELASLGLIPGVTKSSW